MILVVFGHQLRGERLREKVVVERVLLGDGVAADGVAVVRPIGQICPDLALARAVVEVAVLDRLGAAHLVDADVAIRNRDGGPAKVQPHRTAEQDGSAADDEAVGFPLGVVGGIDLVADLVGEQRLLRRQRCFNG